MENALKGMFILFLETCLAYWSGTMFIGPIRDLELRERTKNEFLKQEQLNENPAELQSKKEQYQKSMDFGIALYKNLENVLEKRAQKSYSQRGRDSAFNVGIEDSDPHATTNLDEMIFVNQMKHFDGTEGSYDNGQKMPVDERKRPFNVIKWLQNDDEIENDSEEELQELMAEERRKKETNIRKECDKKLAEEKEQFEKKKQRKRRFLRWAREKLRL